MTASRSNFSELLAPGLAHVFFHEFDVWQPEYTEIVKVRQSAKEKEEDLLIVGLGIMGEKAEGASVDYDDISQGWKTTYNHTTFAQAIRITQEMYEDDLYNVMDDLTIALARSAIQRMEVDGANILNNAFSTTDDLLADGVSLINASHVLSIGGTQSNALSAEADLSASSLQEAIQIIETATDERSLNVAMKAKRLIVPPQLQWTAAELLDSYQKPGTADNEINALTKKGLTYTVNHFLTDSDAWFVQAEEHKSMWYDRTPISFFKGNDFDTFDCKFSGRMRYSRGSSDWRGWAGSTGA